MADGAMSRRGVQQNNIQGSRGFCEEPCSDFGHRDGGWSQGARGGRGGFGGGGPGAGRGMGRGTGSTISRLMDLATGSGGSSRGDFGRGGAGGARGMARRGAVSTISRLMDMDMGSGGRGGFAGSGSPSPGSYSQAGDSSFVDYNGCNQHQQRDYGGGGMRGQGFRGSSVGHPHGDDCGIRPFNLSSAARGRGIGYEAAPQYGDFGGGFDIRGGHNQNQFSGDQRALGQGSARGGTGHCSSDIGWGDAPRGSWKGGDSMVSRLMDLASSGGSDFADSSNPSRGWGQGRDYGRGRGVRERGRGGHPGRENVGSGGGFLDSGNPSRGGGQGRGGDHGREESGRGNGGHRGREKAGSTRAGTVLTRPNGTTYYVHNEHTLLQNSSKFQEGQNQLPVLDRFLNLCEMAKPLLNHPPDLEMASTTLEKLLLTDNICLTPAYAIKGERIDDLQPFYFRCKVYIDNILIASGVAYNKREAKNKGCNTALKVLGTKNAQIIIATHEKVNNVMELGKQDADIVECPFSSAESNIANILSVPESDEKKSKADFYILEPEELDKSTGMKSTIKNSTFILRQSADFSHMLLTYEFTTSAEGFLCTVKLEGETVATGTAAHQHTAKNLASHAALQNLRQTNWTIVIIKRDKPKPAAQRLTATCGRIRPNNPASRQRFMDKLKAHLGAHFAKLEDYTEWLPLSSELNREENDAVYSVGKEMNLSVQARRLDGTKNSRMTVNSPRFLVLSKKFLSRDFFDYIWEKGGETWRYRLKPPGEIGADIK